MQEKREFKVSDRVTTSRGTYGTTRIGTVTRTTKTMVMVQFPGAREEVRYRHDGFSVGGSTWTRSYISHATNQDYQDIAWQELKSLASRLDKIADEYGRKDAALQLQIAAGKLIDLINRTEDQK